jgi:hypothetical protein
MATFSMTTGKLIAVIVIAILVSSAISVGASTMLAVGPQGPQGEQGEQGETGATGPSGEDGADGADGRDGDDGATGPKGDKGDTGDTGPPGEQGLQGEPGIGFEPTGYISVHASAFVSTYSGTDTVIGWAVMNEDAVDALFYGSVQLPHGATITNVTSYWYDADASKDISCWLCFGTSSYSFIMANVSSSGSGNFGSTVDTSISSPIVNNSFYSYFLQMTIPANPPGSALRFFYVTIGFAYPT